MIVSIREIFLLDVLLHDGGARLLSASLSSEQGAPNAKGKKAMYAWRHTGSCTGATFSSSEENFQRQLLFYLDHDRQRFTLAK